LKSRAEKAHQKILVNLNDAKAGQTLMFGMNTNGDVSLYGRLGNVELVGKDCLGTAHHTESTTLSEKEFCHLLYKLWIDYPPVQFNSTAMHIL
jgi:hypothetical protein